MKTLKYIWSIACFFINLMIWADPIINFTFKPYPVFPSPKYCHQAMKDLGQMSSSCRFGIFDTHLVSGIEVTYSGYLTVSDELGEVSFPHKPTKPIVEILITNKISPVMMAGNTVHHWEIENSDQAKLFRFSFEKDNLNPAVTYWNAQSVPLPSDNAIALQTIIILANPLYIEVPLGITPLQESANIILPDIYVKKGINNISQALYAINIKHLFDGVHYLNKKEPKHGISLINP